MNLPALHVSVDALEEVAEAYLLNRLSDSDIAEYEEHLLVCQRCRATVEDTEGFIHLLRTTLEFDRVPAGM